MQPSFNRIKFIESVFRFFSLSLTPCAIFIFAVQIVLFVSTANAQSIFEREKQKWMARDGKLLDGGFNPGYNFFAWFANGTQDQHYGEIQKIIDDLLTGESWYGGNRGNGGTAVQLYFWFGDKLRAAEKTKLHNALTGIVKDRNYFGIGNSNTQIYTMMVRYIMAQYDKTAQVQYNVIDNIYGPPDFTYNGRTYRRGQTYSSYELARDWLYYWFDLVLDAGYIHGELFSEIYTGAFTNCTVTLADSRMVQDPEMRHRAKLFTDFFLLEHAVNANGHHLAGPLGRTYMDMHVYGGKHFYYWDCYWGQMYPTWWGHADGPFISEYRITPLLEDVGRYDDEPDDYWHLVRSNVQGHRNVYITKDFTLGSSPDDGGWMLEIKSNDPGPHPATRPGSPFRVWMNEYADDLNPSACEGECYSQMGTHAHHYKNAVLVKLGDARLYEALTKNKWDIVENHNSGWRFSQEANVGVAIKRGGSSAALEAARLGIDYPSFDAFKNAILSRARLEDNAYVTSKGDRIEARYNQTTKSLETYVNGQDYWRQPPRLEVTTHRGEKVVEWQNRVLTVRKHGRTGIYDFNRWTYREADDGTPIDREPPKTPSGLKVNP